MNDAHDDLTPEQQQQAIENAKEAARSALAPLAAGGLLGGLFRGFIRSRIPRPRLPRLRTRQGRRRFSVLAIGLLVVASSVVTCSAGVDLDKMTAEYGDRVPATIPAARAFAERAAAAVGNASNKRFRITVTEAEATSALSLGLMMGELTRAMDSLPPEAITQAGDIEKLREMLRQREAAARDTLSTSQRIATILDPHLRTGDIQVRFRGNGEVVMAGYIQAWRFRQPGLAVFAPSARSGELKLDFVKGRLGRLPAPAFTFDLLGKLVATLILQGRNYAEISELTVQEGRLTFEARLNR